MQQLETDGTKEKAAETKVKRAEVVKVATRKPVKGDRPAAEAHWNGGGTEINPAHYWPR